MKFFSSITLASLAAFASAASVNLDKRASALDVKLTRVSNSVVKISVTNTGAKDLSLFNKGNLLDTLDTEKVQVFSKDSKVNFHGLRVRPYLSDIQADALTTIKAGHTIHRKVDVASVHDLSSGGTFTLVSNGVIPFAEAGSTKLSEDGLAFESNTLTIDVDGAEAAKVGLTFSASALTKRTRLQSDCTGSRGTATRNALTNCVRLANNAATAARSGSAAKFQEYFKTTSSTVRTTVANRLSAVARECSSTTSGATTQYCTDVLNSCGSNVLAYTLPSQNLVVNCPLYFSILPNLTGTCHAQDQTTTTLHEFTHAPGVYSPGTQDYGYGYQAATSLSSSRAVLNADSYALYANAIYVGC